MQRAEAANQDALAAGIDRLAALAVGSGVGLRAGQELVILSIETGVPLEALPFVRRVTEHAYRAGASLVTTIWADDASTRTRLEHASQDAFDVAADWLQQGIANAFGRGAAGLLLFADNPLLLAGVDGATIGRASAAHVRARMPMQTAVFTMRTNWSGIAVATPSWARAVFPDLPEQVALARLWDAIFDATRVRAPDPAAAWSAHLAELRARADALNGKRFAALHVRAPGTDLRIGLVDAHSWISAEAQFPNGTSTTLNMPTEEVNTIPDCRAVEGHVRLTRPCFVGGTMIRDATIRFEGGRAVEATAGAGEEMLRAVLATDEGASRLGEVALVANSSPVSRSGLTFMNTLLDENTACHFAFGQSWPIGMQHGLELDRDEMARRGANQSLIHVDMMFGSGEVDVDGLRSADRSAEPIMRAGEWV